MSSSAIIRLGAGVRRLRVGLAVIKLQGMRMVPPPPDLRTRHMGTLGVEGPEGVPTQGRARVTELATFTNGCLHDRPTVAVPAAKVSHPLGQRATPTRPRQPPGILVQPEGHLPTRLVDVVVV